MMDYIYIPLGGSRVGAWMKIRNIFIIFVVSGLWHGADWTYVIWGFLSAVYFLPIMLLKKHRQNTDVVAEGRLIPSFRELMQMVSTFTLFSVSLIIFRSDSIQDAIQYFSKVFSSSLFDSPIRDFWTMNTGNHIIHFTISIFLLFIIEWLQRTRQHGLDIDEKNVPRFLRWSIYYLVILACFMMNGIQQEFIYFQF